MSEEEDPSLDYYYSDDDDRYSGDFANSKFLEELENDSKEHREKNYTILTEEDIRRQIEDAIRELSGVLSVSKQEASILLRHYNWSASKVHDAWFADEPAVRSKVGLLLEEPEEQINRSFSNNDLTCGICFESCQRDLIKSAACCHPFCGECWGLYIKTNVNDGPGCLMLRCPEPSCSVAVSEDMIDELAFEDDKKKYYGFLARSYVEDNKKRKWCPAPGCECAIYFFGGDGNFDVSCMCSHSFCWNCCEERHRPVECETVTKWMLKNSSDSQNDAWKKAYTKDCPKCNRSIEKNDGCMRMTCRAPCNFQFCWICLESWEVHGYSGACNKYHGNPEIEGTGSLRRDLLKYQHYYDRWAANENSRQIALRDLEKVKMELVEKIQSTHCQVEAELIFLTEAWQQIVECRQVLKWTYAYGYYLPENELVKKQLFEYLQGQAESGLERLHDCAEKELKVFVDDARPSSKSQHFQDFRRKLIELTKITKSYFENLVEALENGLSDVVSQGSCGSDEASSSRKRKNEYSIIKDDNPRHRAQRFGRLVAARPAALAVTRPAALAVTRTAGLGVAQPAALAVAHPAQGKWNCGFCSYVNSSSATTCEMCHRGSLLCKHCTYANPRSSTSCQICDEKL